MIKLTGAELDYDDGQMHFQEAADILAEAGISAILHTSPSHKPELPKWRVLLPFQTPVKGSTLDMKAYRKKAVVYAEKALGIMILQKIKTQKEKKDILVVIKKERIGMIL